ncbi:MAG: esterase family protein [Candidatus Limnocylindria bacterium]
MSREYRAWYSPALERDMELLVFGQRGTPVLVFPTSMGRFYQWEDFGLVPHLRPRIDAGLLHLWCVDSVDGESFYDRTIAPEDRARRHLAYERYVCEEVVPAIRAANEDPHLTTIGASFGALHAALLVIRRPGVARRAVCLSGSFDTARWLDGSYEGEAYFVNPLAFLPGLREERYLAPLRETEIIIATGEDDPHVEQSRRLAALLVEKGVPARLHVWSGWAHDWPFWKDMVDVFL